MRPRCLREAVLSTVLGLSGGCALMANSTTQLVDVTSSPSGARVLVDGRAAGATPLRVELPRRRAGVVLRFDKDGFQSEQRPLRGSLSRSLWGNAYFLARPPMNDYTWGRWTAVNAIVWGLDFATGAAFAFPSHVDVELTTAGNVRGTSPRLVPPAGRRLSWGPVVSEARLAAARLRTRRGAGAVAGPMPSGEAQ